MEFETLIYPRKYIPYAMTWDMNNNLRLSTALGNELYKDHENPRFIIGMSGGRLVFKIDKNGFKVTRTLLKSGYMKYTSRLPVSKADTIFKRSTRYQLEKTDQNNYIIAEVEERKFKLEKDFNGYIENTK